MDNGFAVIVVVIVGLAALILALCVGLIIWLVAKKVRQHRANASSPVLTVPARVVSRRTGTSGGGNSSTVTRHYVTFERPDGQRIELPMKGEEFGMLAEGDQGQLTHQGTWFKGLARELPGRDHA